jgi:NAD-reducing hydrogenase large subunit
MRRYGQQIIERLGGKRVHANFSVAGGVNAPLTEEGRKATAKELKDITAIAQEAIGKRRMA